MQKNNNSGKQTWIKERYREADAEKRKTYRYMHRIQTTTDKYLQTENIPLPTESSKKINRHTCRGRQTNSGSENQTLALAQTKFPLPSLCPPSLTIPTYRLEP